MNPDNGAPLSPYEEAVLHASEQKLATLATKHNTTREKCHFELAPSGVISLEVDGEEVHWFFDIDELCEWILSDAD